MSDATAGMNWRLIPEHCRPGLKAYVEEGAQPGNFLMMLLQNAPWSMVLAAADDVNRGALNSYRQFFLNYLPAECWGSRQAVHAWLGRGLAGQQKPPQPPAKPGPNTTARGFNVEGGY
jgi:hypothetical protein